MEQKVLDEQTVAERLLLPVEVLRQWRADPARQSGPRWMERVPIPAGPGKRDTFAEGYDPHSVERFMYSSEHARALFERVQQLTIEREV